MNRGAVAAIALAVVIVGVAVLPALDVFDRRLSAFRSGDDDVALAIQLAQDNVGYATTSTIASLTPLDVVADPSATVVVILGVERGFTDAEVRTLEALMEAGGAVVLADEGPNANALAGRHGIQVQPGTLLRATGEDASTTVQSELFGAPFQLIAGRALEVAEDADVEVLATTPPDTVRDMNDNRLVDPEGDPSGEYPVVVRAPVGDGELVVVGDVTAFTNQVLEQGGNVASVLALWNELADGRGTLLVDESRHVQGPGEAASTPVRVLLALTGLPLASALLVLVALVGLLLARRAGVDEVTTHTPDLEATLADVMGGGGTE